MPRVIEGWRTESLSLYFHSLTLCLFVAQTLSRRYSPKWVKLVFLDRLFRGMTALVQATLLMVSLRAKLSGKTFCTMQGIQTEVTPAWTRGIVQLPLSRVRWSCTPSTSLEQMRRRKSTVSGCLGL
jgi:hypothetical protein